MFRTSTKANQSEQHHGLRSSAAMATALPAPPLASQILIRRPILPSDYDRRPRSSDPPSKAYVSSSGRPTAPLVASLATGCTGSHPTVPNYSLKRSTAHLRSPAAHVRVRISMPQRLGQPYVSNFGMNTLQRGQAPASTVSYFIRITLVA